MSDRPELKRHDPDEIEEDTQGSSGDSTSAEDESSATLARRATVEAEAPPTLRMEESPKLETEQPDLPKSPLETLDETQKPEIMDLPGGASMPAFAKSTGGLVDTGKMDVSDPQSIIGGLGGPGSSSSRADQDPIAALQDKIEGGSSTADIGKHAAALGYVDISKGEHDDSSSSNPFGSQPDLAPGMGPAGDDMLMSGTGSKKLIHEGGGYNINTGKYLDYKVWMDEDGNHYKQVTWTDPKTGESTSNFTLTVGPGAEKLKEKAEWEAKMAAARAAWKKLEEEKQAEAEGQKITTGEQDEQPMRSPEEIDTLVWGNKTLSLRVRGTAAVAARLSWSSLMTPCAIRPRRRARASTSTRLRWTTRSTASTGRTKRRRTSPAKAAVRRPSLPAVVACR